MNLFLLFSWLQLDSEKPVRKQRERAESQKMADEKWGVYDNNMIKQVVP